MGRHAKPWIPSSVNRALLATLGVAGLGIAVVSGVNLMSDAGSSGSSVSADQAQLSAVPSGTASGSAPATPFVSVDPSASGTPGQTAAAVYPVSVSIPSIKVQTTLQFLTLTSAGVLNPPTDLTQAGWYSGSSVPGQPGPSVLAGHVDSVSGPAVFYRLGLLKVGDTVTVTLSDQSTVQFAVTYVDSYPKDDFPTQSVYGPVPDPELRLITCGGSFANGHYLNNVVVYATLIGSST